MRRLFLAVAIATILAAPLAAQASGSKSAKPPESPLAKASAALPLRSVGPSLMSGRLADIAVHPTAPGIWYVAAGSGGVWKTTNAGTTWTPVFDDPPSYSIGEITHGFGTAEPAASALRGGARHGPEREHGQPWWRRDPPLGYPETNPWPGRKTASESLSRGRPL